MRPFTEHPDSVGESYFEHMGQALSFAAAMFGGALACCVHAFLPFVFERTASRHIARLHDRMVANRQRKAMPPREGALSGE